MTESRPDYKTVPGDLERLRPWLNVIRRLVSVSHTGAFGILSIQILVNEKGQPVRWSCPEVALLEPRYEASDTFSIQGVK